MHLPDCNRLEHEADWQGRGRLRQYRWGSQILAVPSFRNLYVFPAFGVVPHFIKNLSGIPHCFLENKNFQVPSSEMRRSVAGFTAKRWAAGKACCFSALASFV